MQQITSLGAVPRAVFAKIHIMYGVSNDARSIRRRRTQNGTDPISTDDAVRVVFGTQDDGNDLAQAE